MEIWQNRKIILASKSPRRQQLLEAAGIPFEVMPIEVDESYPAQMPAEEVAVYLARKKAASARSFIRDEEIVLASDSTVVLDGEIYGKPSNYEEAVRTLQILSGRMHQVITGVCLLSKEKERAFAGIARVFFQPLSRDEIDYYIHTFQPYDKAGAYAIQEWIGLCKVARIEGTVSNIMGLPMELVYEELRRF